MKLLGGMGSKIIKVKEIIIIIIHKHIRIEKREWKKALKIGAPVKMVNVITRQKLHMVDSNFSQLVIHILNLFFQNFGFNCFTLLLLYKNICILSQFTRTTLSLSGA